MNGIRRKKTFHIWVVVISVVFIGAILGNIYKVSPQPLVSRLAGYLRALIYFSLIICEDSKTLLAKELEYCLLESSEAISSCGINCSLNKNTTGYLQAFDALLLYDFFEEIVEAVLPTLAALFLSLIHI